jgi:hypothetical protein
MNNANEEKGIIHFGLTNAQMGQRGWGEYKQANTSKI